MNQLVQSLSLARSSLSYLIIFRSSSLCLSRSMRNSSLVFGWGGGQVLPKLKSLGCYSASCMIAAANLDSLIVKVRVSSSSNCFISSLSRALSSISDTSLTPLAEESRMLLKLQFLEEKACLCFDLDLLDKSTAGVILLSRSKMFVCSKQLILLLSSGDALLFGWICKLSITSFPFRSSLLFTSVISFSSDQPKTPPMSSLGTLIVFLDTGCDGDLSCFVYLVVFFFFFLPFLGYYYFFSSLLFSRFSLIADKLFLDLPLLDLPLFLLSTS